MMESIPDVLYMIRARIDSGKRKGAPQLTKDRRVLAKAEAEILKLRDENAALKAEKEWLAIDYAPKDRRILIKSTSGEIYVAHWVCNPMTGDEAWLISETEDGTQHIIYAVEWRAI